MKRSYIESLSIDDLIRAYETEAITGEEFAKAFVKLWHAGRVCDD